LIRVRNQLLTLSGVFLAGVALLNLVSIVNRPERVEDSEYRAVVRARELINEILPPPQYIVESYVVALESVGTQDTRELDHLQKRWNQLESDYSARHEYWYASLADSDLRREMLETAYGPALKFFSLGDEELWPAVAHGETERARALVYTDLRELYERRRAGVDQAMTRSSEVVAASQRAAADAIAQHKSTVTWWSCAIALVGLAAGWIFTRGLVRSMHRTADVLAKVAGRDLSTRLNVTTDDEFGQIDRALDAALSELGDTLTEVRRSALVVQGESRQVSTAASLLSSGTREQASALEQTTANFEELSLTILRISATARTASELAQRCADNARAPQDFAPQARNWTELSAQFELAAREQGAAIAQLTAALDRIEHTTPDNAEQSDKLCVTAQALAGQADQLLNLVASFDFEAGSAEGRPASSAPSRASPSDWPEPRGAMPSVRSASSRNAPPHLFDPDVDGDSNPTDGWVDEP